MTVGPLHPRRKIHRTNIFRIRSFKWLYATLIFDSVAQFKSNEWFSSPFFSSLLICMFSLTLVYSKTAGAGETLDVFQSPLASGPLSTTIWGTVGERSPMQWDRLSGRYRTGPDTPTLERNPLTSRERREEGRYILFILYFCGCTQPEWQEAWGGMCVCHVPPSICPN